MIWIDDNRLQTLEHPESDHNFAMMRNFIGANGKFFLSSKKNEVMNVLKKYKLAYRAVDLVIALLLIHSISIVPKSYEKID